MEQFTTGNKVSAKQLINGTNYGDDVARDSKGVITHVYENARLRIDFTVITIGLMEGERIVTCDNVYPTQVKKI